jgi:hypothetical protein
MPWQGYSLIILRKRRAFVGTDAMAVRTNDIAFRKPLYYDPHTPDEG